AKIHADYAAFSGEAQRLAASTGKLDEIAAQEAGINAKELHPCIVKQDDRGIKASITEGDNLGVQNTTPTIFVNGERLVGAPGEELLWAAVDRALKSQGVEPPSQLSQR
ncbi:MAG TPA: thioredoxin domain-containing protein, partial [Bryobacteraceae bacterium]|nr:thioredoxin domain-containing protein [Bryobacteraceae bacterium]